MERKKLKRKGIGISLPIITIFIFLSTILGAIVIFHGGKMKHNIVVTYEGMQDYTTPLTFVFLYSHDCSKFFLEKDKENIEYIYNYLDNPTQKNLNKLKECFIYFMDNRINNPVNLGSGQENKQTYSYALLTINQKSQSNSKKQHNTKIEYVKGIYEIKKGNVYKKYYKEIPNNVLILLQKSQEKEVSLTQNIINLGITGEHKVVDILNYLSAGIATNFLNIKYIPPINIEREKIAYTSYIPIKYEGEIYDITISVISSNNLVKKSS